MSRPKKTGALRTLTNIELIERVLCPKIAGEALAADVAHLRVHYADLYSDTPDELAARLPMGLHSPPGLHRNWYFFSHARYRNGGKQERRPRRRRGGWWLGYTPRSLERDNGLVAYFRFYSYRVNGKDKSDWMMIEYSLPHDQQNDDGQDLVLCKMYKLRRRHLHVRDAPPQTNKRPSVTCDDEHSEKRYKQDEAADPGKGGNETEFDATLKKDEAADHGKERNEAEFDPTLKKDEAADHGKEGNEAEFDPTLKKDEAADLGKQVIGDGHPAISAGRVSVENSADSGKRNGPRDEGTHTGAV